MFSRVLMLIVCFLFLPGMYVLAQKKKDFVKGTFKEEQSFVYKNDWTLGANVHSNGWGANFVRGKELEVTKRLIYEADLVYMKHPKEYSLNSYFESGESYVYGKINSFIVLRTGIGIQKAIFIKAEKGGVEIRYAYSGGLSLGFVKPVYLQIFDSNEVKIERFNVEKHNASNIYGTASFFQGIGETRLYPGLYVKGGLNFEFGPYDDTIRILEVGAIFDAYLKKVPTFATYLNYDINKQTYLSFYVAFAWGKRW